MTETDGPFARVNDLSLLPWDVGIALESLGRLWGVTQEEASAVSKDNIGRLTTFEI
jgi:hypothetical protein